MTTNPATATPGPPGEDSVESTGAAHTWRAVLEGVRSQIPKPTFDTWLKDTEGVGADDLRFIVRVSTPFKISWIERRMYQPLQEELEKVTGRYLDISFTTHRMDADGWPVLNSPGMDDNCTLLPCLRDHDTPEHHRNLIAYLRDHWDVWDPEAQVEIWSREMIEATIEELREIRFPFKRYNTPSGYFLTVVATVAGWAGLETREIERRKQQSRMLNQRRPRRERVHEQPGNH